MSSSARKAAGDRTATDRDEMPPAPAALPSPVTDTHCHLDIARGPYHLPDPKRALADAAAVNVTRLVQIGTDLPGSAWAIEAAETFDEIVAGVALHPNEAPELERRVSKGHAVENDAASSPLRPSIEIRLDGNRDRAGGIDASALALGRGRTRSGLPRSKRARVAAAPQARRRPRRCPCRSVRGEARRGVRGVGVGARQLTGTGPLQLATLKHQAVDALAAGPPGHQPALHLRAVEARALGELPRRQEPRRSGDASDQVQGSVALRGVDPDLPDRRPALSAEYTARRADRFIA